jgi:opacity protein-like surface antigen
MKTIILRALLAAACLTATSAQAQWSTYRPEQSLMLVGWGLAQPVGKMTDFQTGSSVAGFAMEFRSIVRTRVSAGLAFDYNRFEKTNSMESVTNPDGSALSAPTYRYSDQFGIKATAHYYFTDAGLRPYLGGGLGGNWNYSYLQIADLASTDSGFTVIFSPEAGLLWELTSGRTAVSLNLAVRYNITTAYFLGVENAQWFSEVLGVAVAY